MYPAYSCGKVVNSDNQPIQSSSSSNDEHVPEEAYLVLGGMIFPIEGNIFTIGRNPENDLVLNDPRISRFHAEVRYLDHHYLLVDTNSNSGTFLNNQRITISQLLSGDIIQISHTPIMFMLSNTSEFEKLKKQTWNLNNPDYSP